MKRRSPNRLVRTVADAMWRRDKLQMRAAGALLSMAAARGRRTAAARARPAARRRPWSGFQSLLCPIDFSEHSRKALRFAEAICRRSGAALTVLYANDPLLVSAAAAVLRDRHMAKRSARELQAFVDQTIHARSPVRRRMTTRVSIGTPPDEILKAASRGRCDLIVLGTHGLTAAARLILGSTTISVLQRARVPVLAVPRGARSKSVIAAG